MYVYIHKELKINWKFCRCAIALDNFFYLFYFPNTRKLEEKETWVKNPGEVKVFLTWTDQRDVWKEHFLQERTRFNENIDTSTKLNHKTVGLWTSDYNREDCHFHIFTTPGKSCKSTLLVCWHVHSPIWWVLDLPLMIILQWQLYKNNLSKFTKYELYKYMKL